MIKYKLRTALFLCLVSLSFVTQASSFGVYPLVLELSEGKKSGAMQIQNHGSSTPIQTKIFKWDRVDGQDVLVPSRDIIVTPPIVTVGKGEIQTIRLRLKSSVEQLDVEQSYRIKIKQLKPNELEARLGSLIRMEMSIPVFVPPKSKVGIADIQSVRYDGSGYMITVENQGNVHLKLFKAVLFNDSGEGFSTDLDEKSEVAYSTHTQQGTNYIFPGETAEIHIATEGRLGSEASLALVTDFRGYSRASNLSEDGIIWLKIPQEQD